MNVDLRPVGLGYSYRRVVRFRTGLGETCQVPVPGQPMVYPACPSVSPITGAPAPAVYRAPTLTPPPACTQDTQPGGAAFSQACIDLVLANQQRDFAASTAANYSVDRANCENAWAANAARYQADGLPVPPNDCAERTFGLTLPGTTGGTSADIPNAGLILGADPLPASAPPAAAAPPPAPIPPAPAAAPSPDSTQTKLLKTYAPGPSTPPSSAKDSTGGSADSGGSPNQALYWVGGLAAALVLVVAVSR